MASPEDNTHDFESLRQHTLTGFGAAILARSPWINSEGANEDMAYDLRAIKTASNWQPGEPITEEHRYNVASRFILRDLLRCFTEEEPLSFSRNVWAVDDLYEDTEQALQDLGIKPVFTDKKLVMSIVLCCFKGKPAETAAETAAQGVWNDRGEIVQNMVSISDMVKLDSEENALQADPVYIAISPGGVLMEAYSPPEPPVTPKKMHFYEQYISATKGARAFLRAYLEDLAELDSRLTAGVQN